MKNSINNSNEQFMIYDSADEERLFIEELLQSLLSRYQIGLDTMKGTNLIFDCVYLLYYKCYKINPN